MIATEGTTAFTTSEPPAGAGEVIVALRGGERLQLIPVTPVLAPLMADLLERLSPEARRMRFFQSLPTVPPSMVRRLCDVDHVDHVAWLAVSDEGPVAEARFVRSRRVPWQAEVAITVRDDWHRRGLGRLMIEALGIIATERGITTFTCDVLADNRASMKLFTALGTTFRFDDGAVVGTGPVPAWSAPEPLESAIRRLQAAVEHQAPLQAVA
jgi:RimJ/RimL family protein N-acetyltransferase